jgi:uncharacterized Ntn-hydrolase superfamily protein
VTYSIVARDATTGELGVAVQSCFPWVGATVAWAAPGLGAVATQAIAEASFGPLGLELLRSGRPAPEVVASLVALDGGAAPRQVGVVDAHGTAAAHTGSMCVPEAGHEVADGLATAANMMESDRVWPSMAEAFATSEGDLASRLLAALDRAIELLGVLDVEGARSAARSAVDQRPGLLDAALIVISMTAALDGIEVARSWVADWGGDRARVKRLWQGLIAAGLAPDDPGVVDQVLS